MNMKFLGKIIKKMGTTTYSLAKLLRENGVDITHQGVDFYGRGKARSMRLDVVAGIRRLSGYSWEEMGKMIDDEFLTDDLKE